MPKGKKFTAAEKHFHEKEIILRRELNRTRDRVYELRAQLDEAFAEMEKLTALNDELEARNAVLQQTVGLTDAEVRDLVKRAQSLNTLAGVMDHMPRFY